MRGGMLGTHVCMRGGMHVGARAWGYMHVGVRAWGYACLRGGMHVGLHARGYACRYACMQVCVRGHACMLLCVNGGYVCGYTCMRVKSMRASRSSSRTCRSECLCMAVLTIVASVKQAGLWVL